MFHGGLLRTFKSLTLKFVWEYQSSSFDIKVTDNQSPIELQTLINSITLTHSTVHV